LPQPIETALFRVVQEGLTNIQRHSGSPSAIIRNPQSGEIRLGVGVPGMHERMAQLGGRLEIDSSSAGTTVRATILLPDVVSTETLDDSTSRPHRG
jgi:signal transduction histidine kinase